MIMLPKTTSEQFGAVQYGCVPQPRGNGDQIFDLAFAGPAENAGA
jgi:hypothetical protein